jgi:regulator of cell morphogenesis and NO signaling
LARIVNDNHKAANVFEKHQLDFCCNGKRSLQQACDELNLSVDQIISEIEIVASDSSHSGDYDKMSLTELSNYIVTTHHKYVKHEMPLIFSYMEKVAAKHGEKHPEMLQVLDTFAELKKEMIEHMQKEEVILFPGIRMIEIQTLTNGEIEGNLSYVESTITMMEQEHEHAGDLLKQIRDLTNNYTLPVEACTTYRLSFAALQAFEIDLHQHVHLENNILFPKAIKLFSRLNELSSN